MTVLNPVLVREAGAHASPQEILDTQDRFDNHFLDNPVWRDPRARAL